MTAFDPQALAERLGALLVIVAVAVGIVAPFAGARWKAVLTLVIAIASLAPIIGGLSATDILFSVIGPLSGASLVLLASWIADRFHAVSRRASDTLRIEVLAFIILLAGIPLYVMVLGVGRFDPYRLGFGGWPLPLGIALLLLVGLWLRSGAVALWVLVSGALYLASAYTSRNLVDYLIDPVAMILAAVVLIAALIRRRRAR